MSHGSTRFFAGCCLAVLLLAGCGRRPAGEVTPEERAAAVAKSCYEALYQGHPELFLDGRDGAGQLPADYRSQLLDAYRQHVSETENNHRGVRSVAVSDCQRDSTLGVMQVFLVVNYGDGTKEEIVTPMVERNGVWLMK